MVFEMKQYVITEEQLKAIEKWDTRKLGEEYRSHPFSTELNKVLDTLAERASVQSEYEELPCQDGWHTGEHTTEVIRISYLEREIDALRGVEE